MKGSKHVELKKVRRTDAVLLRTATEDELTLNEMKDKLEGAESSNTLKKKNKDLQCFIKIVARRAETFT